ncbi:MAG TPA: aldo/keto reductase [Rhizomicrobium sp.]|jgi:aryl-alcohol dehydrogenase (NADP+)|nr:aldo/keto reductase [Rhizomicrobium sp.]
MEKVRLGNTGLKVSRICLGTMTYGSPKWRDWVLEEDASRPFIRRALEAGINFFDTADIYSQGVSEEIVGRALRDFCPVREDYVLATKVFFPVDGRNGGLSRKHIMHAIDNSLRRLGMDHVDLYQIHRFDNATPIEETIEALHDVVKAGKARYIGASSMHAWQFAKYLATAQRMGMTKFVTMQNFYNLVYREEEREMLPLCRDAGIGVIPWSPLARGFLGRTHAHALDRQTARAKSDNVLDMQFGDADLETLRRVEEIGARRGAANAQIAVAWLLAKGVAAPIIGASKMSHLEDAIAAASIMLTDEEVKYLEEPYRPKPVAGNLR